MANYAASDKDYGYRIQFILDGQPVSPSEATYTVTDNAGAVVESLEDVAVLLPNLGDTYADIVIPAAANEKTLANEVRYVTVTFTHGGLTHTFTDFYFLRDGIRLPISPDDVRSLIGATSSEIADSQVDLFSAYAQVQTDAPNVNLDAILTSGDARFPALLEAVKVKAAMNLSTTFETSIMQMEQADNTLYRRFEEIDFDSMRNTLAARYSAALRILTGDDSFGVAPLMGIFAVGTDPVTGV